MIDAVNVRLEEHSRRIDRLEESRPAVIAAHVDELRQDVLDLRREVTSLKRSFYTFALSITGSTILLSFTAFQVWGQS